MNTLTRISPPTFPARPMNGGRYEIALPKRGIWFYEPKYNGWRATVHTPTGAMFNRHNEPLTIEAEFESALSELRKCPFEWLDVEALERRHKIAQGSLFVLDIMQQHGIYTERRGWMEQHFTGRDIGPHFLKDNRVYLTPSVEQEKAAGIWDILKKHNAELGVEFYEGMVAKRADSHYPFQLRNSKQETPHWIKHRWEF